MHVAFGLKVPPPTSPPDILRHPLGSVAVIYIGIQKRKRKSYCSLLLRKLRQLAQTAAPQIIPHFQDCLQGTGMEKKTKKNNKRNKNEKPTNHLWFLS